MVSVLASKSSRLYLHPARINSFSHRYWSGLYSDLWINTHSVPIHQIHGWILNSFNEFHFFVSSVNFMFFLLQWETQISLLKATKLQPQCVQSINVTAQLASILLTAEGPERMEPPQIPKNGVNCLHNRYKQQKFINFIHGHGQDHSTQADSSQRWETGLYRSYKRYQWVCERCKAIDQLILSLH